MERKIRTLQVNWYSPESTEPQIVIIKGDFISQDDAEEYGQIYQDYLRAQQLMMGYRNISAATVRVLKEFTPDPRSKPPKNISYGTMVPLEILLE